ncbi:MAG TPA: hypothetical protein VLG16_04270 [Candidatus Saccharimonadales bacterium]|nr:hypothetical protein [Candidatus Saccharimonadales bacterium]
MAAEVEPEVPLRVISAGCSFGAEADTVLALAHKNMPNRRVAVLGLDYNPLTLEAARTGSYLLRNSLEGAKVLYGRSGFDFETTMADHGVTVEPRDFQDAAGLSTRTLRRELWKVTRDRIIKSGLLMQRQICSPAASNQSSQTNFLYSWHSNVKGN